MILNHKGTKITKIFFILLLSGMVLISSTFAQDETLVTARFTTSNPRPLTGEVFTLELTINVPSGNELAELPTFPESGAWGDFEIVALDEVEVSPLTDGTVVYHQVLTVRLWQPRDYNTPETFVGYRLTGFNDIQRIPVRQEQITVPTVLDFEDLTLRPFKPLIYLPYLSPWVVVAGVILVGAVAGFGYRWWQRRPKRLPAAERAASPGEIALQKLASLKTKTSEENSPAAQYTQVAAMMREYVQGQYGVGELTTAELTEQLREYLPEKMLTDLGRILTEADLVKFAGAEAQPDAEIARRLTEAARRWIVTNMEQNSNADFE